MSYFEESFFEEDEVTEDHWDMDDKQIMSSPSKTPFTSSPRKLFADASPPKPSPRKRPKTPSKSPGKQLTLWNYMKPEPSASDKVEKGNGQNMVKGDWLEDMDELWEDDDAGAPWPKKQKLDP